MTALPPTAPVAVIGAGTMGAGIAQVAAAAGHPVLLFDLRAEAPAAAKAGIGKALDRVVAKGRMTEADRDALLGRVTPVTDLAALAPAKLAIEAVLEDLAVKQAVFRDLEAVTADDAILATNTSSLSITAIAAGLSRPANLVGMHFFNPVPLMALVEVIHGLATDPAVVETIHDTAAAWSKAPVRATSTPGFIVNRVARPFYGEALRLLDEGAADPATIDAALTGAGGFRMGPFALMDLIGHDVNYAVTCSVFDAFSGDPRYRPSLRQKALVDAGFLGRKSGRGFYDHGEGAAPLRPALADPAPPPAGVVIEGDLGPAQGLAQRIAESGLTSGRAEGDGTLVVEGAVLALTDGRSATQRAADAGLKDLVLFDLALDYGTATHIAVAAADQAAPAARTAAVGLFQALGFQVLVVDDAPGLLVMRTVAMLANEGAEAVHLGVTDAPGVDTAMMKGVNYPRGPLAWADAIGPARVLAVLDNLAAVYGEDRYRASALLRRRVAAGRAFHV
ncbi:MAG: 3-hydroxyacyl-CoA dehydrogenase PaaC [Rhodobacterales bacterium]|nr:3-hydroxyacyl-CoA dehydrogenase PaaC [Rhodobacterales bacterium]